MKQLTEQHQSLIDGVVDSFNFERVHKVMEHLEWKWWFPNVDETRVPTIFEIKQSVRKQLKRAILECYTEHSVSATGGFEYHVFMEDGEVCNVEIKFIVTEAHWDVSYDE